MNPSRISRTKAPVGWRYASWSKSCYTGLRGATSSQGPGRHSTEIRPKGCLSEKRHIPNLDAVVFQNMHVRALGNFFDICNELRNLLPGNLRFPKSTLTGLSRALAPRIHLIPFLPV